MKKWNKTIAFCAIISASTLLQQNLYAGFFDEMKKNLSDGLQKSLTGNTAAPANNQAQRPVQPPPKPTGYATKATNVRSGPGSKNAKVFPGY